ncbi:MAG: molybdenum cofactor guanylyltransferase [Desulfobacterales bacterium]|nr:molybdenum cofactor guanylyltransferase [Desulfobacterales bacterium]
MKIPCSGVILAGGLNSRFFGSSKALIRVGNERILDHIYNVFTELFEEIILVANDPLQYLEWDCVIATDIFQIRSSLTGIHAGLFYTSNPFAFFAACDTPFLKKELAETIIDSIETRSDVFIPETSAGLEPLCAVYSKQCLKPIEQQLIDNKLKIQGFFNKIKVRKISETILREKDPELVSFFNINTPDQLDIAEKISSKKTEER